MKYKHFIKLLFFIFYALLYSLLVGGCIHDFSYRLILLPPPPGPPALYNEYLTIIARYIYISISLLNVVLFFRKAEERARKELERRREKLAEEMKSREKR